jgi:hypothetical protein
MKLLGNGYTTAETTFAGTIVGGTTASAYGAQASMKVEKIVAFTGGSSVAPNTSGGITFRYGKSSNNIYSTLVILPAPASTLAALDIEINGLALQCSWFEAVSHEAASGGWGIIVMGD